MSEIHNIARESTLISESEIKVRIQTFSNSLVGGEKATFIHVFAHIMEGRIVEQRARLSRRIISRLETICSITPNIAMNIYEFEKETYLNKSMLL